MSFIRITCVDRQEPCIHILIRCLKRLRIGKIKLWDQSVATSWEIYTILAQGINVIIFNPHFLNCHSAWNQFSAYVFICSVSLEICCGIGFQRHLRIMSFWTDSCKSSLWWRDTAWGFFYYCCSVFQAVLPSKLSAYRRSWGKAKFIISVSLLKEIQKVSWSIKAGCLLRNTNCLFLTNYILCWFTTKLDPNITGIFTSSHWSYKEALFWKKTLLSSKYKVCNSDLPTVM